MYKARIDTKPVVLERIFIYLSNKILLARFKLVQLFQKLHEIKICSIGFQNADSEANFEKSLLIIEKLFWGDS